MVNCANQDPENVHIDYLGGVKILHLFLSEYRKNFVVPKPRRKVCKQYFNDLNLNSFQVLREQHGKLSGKIKAFLRVILFIIFNNGLFHQYSLPQTQLTVLADLEFLCYIASKSARFSGLKQLNMSKFPFFGKTLFFQPVFRIRIGSEFNQVSGSGFGIRIRTQEGKNDPQKQKKIKKFHVLKCWMVSFEG